MEDNANRIACPNLPLDGLFQLARDLEIPQVELRNDLPSGSVTDGLVPEDVRAMAEHAGVRIFTVNALQQFNDERVLNPAFFLENDYRYSLEELHHFQSLAAPKVQECIVR